MRDLEARQALRHVPAFRAISVAPKDAEVRGDVEHLLCVVADDVGDGQVSIVRGRRESCRASLDVQVRERARAGAASFDDIEDMTGSRRRDGVITGVRY